MGWFAGICTPEKLTRVLMGVLGRLSIVDTVNRMGMFYLDNIFLSLVSKPNYIV